MPSKRGKDVVKQPVGLEVSRHEAAAKLQDRIDQAPTLSTVHGASEVTEASVEKWDSFNVELLKRLFTSDELAQEYQWSTAAGGVIVGQESPGHLLQRLLKHVAKRVHTLESIKERLELFPERSVVGSDEAGPGRVPDNNKVFVVHGHEEAPPTAVARFLSQLGLDPVILHEQATGGRTLIEKLEYYGDVGFAVVLLTPDDVGTVKENSGKLNPRARQNVILELGYFLGRLTRARVCPLFKGPLELPSDYIGVGFVEMDSADGWHLKLARELKAAGFEVDLNKAL